MRTATAVALAWMAGSLAACAADEPQAAPEAKAAMTAAAQDKKGIGGDRSPIPQDEKVVITVTREKGRTGDYVERLVAKPKFAIIRKGQPLRFAVEGLRPGQHVEVDFEVYDAKKGPFPPIREALRGRYVLDERTTGVATEDSDAAGYFKYHVVLRQGTKDVFALDPGVVVKNDF